MRKATELFGEWATLGRDEGMEHGHAASVGQMLDATLDKMEDGFSAIDLGCGNGWVVRRLLELGAGSAMGVDGAEEMINKARNIDPEGRYELGHLPDWKPPHRFDLVHSMEFLYYLKDPSSMLETIAREWLLPGGWLIAGVDHYAENEESLEWPIKLDVHMTTIASEGWREVMIAAGFKDVSIWITNRDDGKPGTLVMTGRVSFSS